MKKVYSAPEIDIISYQLTDVILASTESQIGETIGNGGSDPGTGFDDF